MYVKARGLYNNLNEENKALYDSIIAKKFKISRSYVSRIEKRALIKLLNQIKKSE